MTEAILTAAGIRKVYRSGGTEVCALKGLDLEVPDGQFLAVMGPSGSATKNVELPLLLARVPQVEARRRAQETLGRVGLGHRLDRRPPELSGGEQTSSRSATPSESWTSPFPISRSASSSSARWRPRCWRRSGRLCPQAGSGRPSRFG